MCTLTDAGLGREGEELIWYWEERGSSAETQSSGFLKHTHFLV
jgi:hypothetical protein